MISNVSSIRTFFFIIRVQQTGALFRALLAKLKRGTMVHVLEMRGSYVRYQGRVRISEALGTQFNFHGV